VVREEKIIPIGGYVLIEPDLESWDDILKPVRSTIKDKDGNFILKPKDQWLQTKVRPDRKYLTGFVRHIGAPLKGDVNELEIGQKIYYRKHADWVQNIEGKEYYAIRQRHIVGKDENGFVPVNGNIGLRGIDKPTVTEAGAILIKVALTTSGYVIFPGKSGLQVNDQVEIADSDRLEIELDKERYLITHANYVLGVHEKV
jgi:co-chaperonin GroES (HSP10)